MIAKPRRRAAAAMTFLPACRARRNLPDAAARLKPPQLTIWTYDSCVRTCRRDCPNGAGAMPMSAVASHERGRVAHGLAAAVLASAVAVGLAATAALAVLADRPNAASGDLVAVFPHGTDEAEALAAVVASDGVIRRGGPFGPVWLVTSAAPGFAGRLREQGAVLVLPGLPFEGLSVGGCSFMAYGSYDRPGIAKLRAGPM
jgi:hypothetical protein